MLVSCKCVVLEIGEKFEIISMVQIWWGERSFNGVVGCLSHARGWGGIFLLNVATQGSILVSKLVIHSLHGSFLCHLMLRHGLLKTQHLVKIWGSFGLCDIISMLRKF
jgi:hypothetical protein